MNVKSWIQDTLSRVYPSTECHKYDVYKALAVKNENIALQVCIRNETLRQLPVNISISESDSLQTRIRKVGYVPISHLSTDTPAEELEGIGLIPGFVPDPLFDSSNTVIGPYETQTFWINVNIDKNAKSELKIIKILIYSDNEIIAEHNVEIMIANIILEKRHDFPVTHWFYADALCDWYNIEPYSDRFWPIVEKYMQDMISHGNNCMYVPIFTPPTDGVKRPTQLLSVDINESGSYKFNFDNIKKWISLAKKNGAEMFEWTHFFSQWGVKNALRIYRSNNDENSLLWSPDTSAVSDTYRGFLAQFLPEFHRFLMDEDLLDKSLFHVSDEPHGDEHLANYCAARSMLKELAPWMKVADALSDVRYGIEGLTDIPIPSISAASEYFKANIPAWTYFCCGPRGAYLNRFVDTPLSKIRMSGWLFYRLKAGGFLHWGYNYWYRSQTRQLIDPFTELASGVWPGFAYGDPFVVYPGESGPIDSIRWEAFAQSLQDYALLQTLKINADNDILNKIQAYDSFPKNAQWINETRNRLISEHNR